jgi:hypothetical protein
MEKSSISKSARALALAVGLYAAQSSLAQVSTGALSGRVAATDQVTVRHLDSGLVREVPVKKDGTFWIRRLPVGTYEVTIKGADGTEEKIMAAAKIGITTRVVTK